jgi:hypothetical protein
MPDRHRARRGARPRRPLAPLALLCLGAAWLSLAAPAHAGRFHVFSCHTPSGQFASADGWSASTQGSAAYAINNCATGGALDAELDGAVDQPANAAVATWTYSPPPETFVAAATLWRYGTAPSVGPNATGLFWLAGPQNIYDSADVFDQCVGTSCQVRGTPSQPLAGSNVVFVPAPNAAGATHLYVNASCGGASGSSCPAVRESSGQPWSAAVHLFAADVTVQYNKTPAVRSVGGALDSAPTASGTQALTFDASDQGPGLYSVTFDVDGQTVSQIPVSTNGGRCRDVGGTSDGTLAFLNAQPCLQAAHVQASLDTSKVSDGTHELSVFVVDAAGNRATVLDRHVQFANGVGVSTAGLVVAAPPRGPVNGIQASDQAALQARWSRGSRPLLISRYGRRRQVNGRLTAPGGHGIAGAAVEVTATPSYPGAAPIDEGVTHTRPDGSWTFNVAGNTPSLTLSFRYRSHVGDSQPVATRTLQLAVRAGLTLSIRPHVAAAGHHITFRGQLLGGPVPPGGKQLVLEARQPGGSWIQFRVIRTGARGRYQASYRFHFPGPVFYQFRVLSKFEAAFPYIAGTSRVVGVFER